MFISSIFSELLRFLTWCIRRSTRPEAGQATAEYALVLLGAALVAIALITWATGSGQIGQLFDAVFDEIRGRL